jgi:hypothetical protein
MRTHGSSRRRLHASIAIICVALVAIIPFTTARRAAAPVSFAAPAFGAAWSPVDEPVASGAVQRPYLWGAGPSSAGLSEPYRDAPGGTRLVQYFDKARMELTDPALGTMTTGLLTRELVTGRIQVGDSPASIEVRGRGSTTAIVGDATNPSPTYSQLRDRIDRPQPDATDQFVTDALLLPPGATADSTLVVQSGGMAQAADDPNAHLLHFVPETGQTIPQAFWSFMTAGGMALDSGALVDRTPLYDWVSVVGLPISPAWWVTARVGGVPTDVMLQLYERRVLTYTPTNPPGFQVEMGNIGQHYYHYRYLSADAPLIPATVAPGAPASGKAPKPTTTRRATTAPISTGAGPVRIVDLVARPPDGAADINGETVTIRNDGLATVDITRWTLADPSGINLFTFPSLVLPPGGMVIVHSGQGSPTATDLYFGKKKAIWKDTGDAATLRDAAGSVVSVYTYTR